MHAGSMAWRYFVPAALLLVASVAFGGEGVPGKVFCIGSHQGFIDHVVVTNTADVDDICKLFDGFANNPSGAPGGGGGGPSPSQVCSAMGGHWDPATQQCVLPPPGPPPLGHCGDCPRGACPTCAAHGPWDVMLATVPRHDGRDSTWVAMVVKAGKAGKRKLFTAVERRLRHTK